MAVRSIPSSPEPVTREVRETNGAAIARLVRDVVSVWPIILMMGTLTIGYVELRTRAMVNELIEAKTLARSEWEIRRAEVEKEIVDLRAGIAASRAESDSSDAGLKEWLKRISDEQQTLIAQHHKVMDKLGLAY